MKKLLTACAALGASIVAQTALAQQSIDEPRLDPLFGQRQPDYEPPVVSDDEEFDQEKGWSPLRGFVGVLTFMTPDATNLSVGVGPVYKPDYIGSNDYELEVDPQVYIKFRNFTFLDDDGADLALFGFSGFRFGPSLRIVGDRKANENPDLMGLDDVGLTFEFGGFMATTFLDRISVRFKVRKGISTGHRGLIVDASSTMLLFRYGRLSTSITGHTSWVGNRYADAYYEVSPQEAIASGYPVYDPDRGFRDFGGSFNAYINIRKHWSLNPYVSYRYITGDIADAPLVDIAGERVQYTVGFHLMREFQFSMY